MFYRLEGQHGALGQREVDSAPHSRSFISRLSDLICSFNAKHVNIASPSFNVDMPSSDVDLGSLDLVTKLPDLQLQLNSSATFLLSAEDDIAKLQEALTSERLSVNSKDKTWIMQSRPLEFVVSLTSACNLVFSEQEELAEALSNRLRMCKVEMCFAFR